MSITPTWLNSAIWPSITDSTLTVFRAAYGALLFVTLLWALPAWRRFFVSERWGGYLQAGPETDRLHRPFVARLGIAVWLTCATVLVVGKLVVVAALINWLFCRHVFVRLRWRGVARGMGAPGFMSYWMACAVLLLEYARHHAPSLLPLALLVLQIDFAFIMLSAGLYKMSAGYPRNNGMELGMCNPEWGYWWRHYQRLRPSHFVFRGLNQLAWSTEVVAAILMLVPQTRLIGALLIMGSFAFIATQIRLGLLCEMVILCGLLFFHQGSAASSLLDGVAAATPAVTSLPLLSGLLRVSLWTYLVLLPFAHAGLFYNFYARRALPKTLQAAFERYTNFFGIIIWRVFSVDVTNFYINIHSQERDGSERELLSRWHWRHGLRYAHVCEAITVTSLFTTLKYYPSNNQLFVERLLRYARTVPHDGALLVFEYVSVVKTDVGFAYIPVAEYLVDVASGTIDERVLDPTAPLRRAHADSPVHEGVRPGSYVALGS